MSRPKTIINSGSVAWMSLGLLVRVPNVTVMFPTIMFKVGGLIDHVLVLKVLLEACQCVALDGVG